MFIVSYEKCTSFGNNCILKLGTIEIFLMLNRFSVIPRNIYNVSICNISICLDVQDRTKCVSMVWPQTM